jgi:predicted glycosyltransferase involved in capsule biosynthesis
MEFDNQSEKGGSVMAVWTEPKIDWSSTDRFNISDYNRIKNNIQWLCDKANELYASFSYTDMGNDIVSYDSYWKVEFFNAFEENIEMINRNIFTKDYGISQRFFENGPFIKWDELNRIENACLSMKDILQRQEAGKTIRLSFRLGNMKGVRA